MTDRRGEELMEDMRVVGDGRLEEQRVRLGCQLGEARKRNVPGQAPSLGLVEHGLYTM